MVLDIRTQTFHDLAGAVQDLHEKGEYTPERMGNLLEIRGVDKQDFSDAYKEYYELKQKDPDIDLRPGATPGRIVGRAVGSTASALDKLYDWTLGHIIPDDWIESGDKYINEEILGDEGQRIIQGLVDPYHGDTLGGVGEQVGGELLSYVMPFKALTKAGSLVKTPAKLNPRLTEKINKSLKSKPAKIFGYGTAGVGTDLLVHDPRINLVHSILQEEDVNKAMERLDKDPNDLVAEAKVNSFLESLGFEAAFGAATFGGAKLLLPAWKKLRRTDAYRRVTTPISQWMTSVRGSDKDMVGRDLERNTTVPRVMMEAEGLSKDVQRRINKEYSKDQQKEIIKAMNNFLTRNTRLNNEQLRAVNEIKNKEGYEDIVHFHLTERFAKSGDPEVAGTGHFIESFMEINEGIHPAKKAAYLKELTDTKNKFLNENALGELRNVLGNTEGAEQIIADVVGMRKNIDDVSKEVSGKLTEELQLTFDANLGAYVTRYYKNWTDPEYRKKLIDNLNSYHKRKLDGTFGKDKLPEAEQVIDNAFQSLKDQTGKEDSEIFNVINEIVSGQDGLAGASEALLKFTGQGGPGSKSAATTLFNRRLNNPEVRKMLGEVENPFENYANTMASLSTLKAQADYTEGVVDDIIKKGLYNVRPEDPRATFVGTRRKFEDYDSGTRRLFNRNGLEVLEKANKVIFGEGNSTFLSDQINAAIRKDAMAKGLASEKELEDLAKPFWIDKAYADYMTESMTTPNISKGLAIWGGLKSLTQQSKTVLHPQTHSINVMGNVAILAANGVIPMGEAMPAFIAAAKKLGNYNSEEFAKEWSEYVRQGIVGSNVELGLVRDNLGELGRKNVDDYISEIAERKKWNPTLKGVAQGKIPVVAPVFRKIRDTYQMEDDVFKIMLYEHNLKMLKKAHKNKNIDEIKQEAAKRTRDLAPNYNLVPKLLKAMRYSPVGDFMAFPAEMLRITKNLGKYTFDDFLSGNKELQKSAARRLAGMTAVGTVPYIFQQMSAADHGITSEMENLLIERQIPSYYQDHARIYLSPIEVNKEGDMSVDFLSMGSLDPFEYMKTFGRGMWRSIATSDLTPDERTRIGFQTAEKVLSPFVGTSMLTDAAINLLNPESREIYPRGSIARSVQESIAQATGLDERFARGIGGVAEVFKPGLFNFFERKVQHERALAAQNPNQETPPLLDILLDETDQKITGKEYTEKGLKIREDPYRINAFFGLRPLSMDLTTGLGYMLNDGRKQHEDGAADFKRTVRSGNLLRDDLPEVWDSYKKALKAGLQGQQMMKRSIDALDLLPGMTEGTKNRIINRAATRRKPGKKLEKGYRTLLGASKNNVYVPFDFGEELKETSTGLRQAEGINVDWYNDFLRNLRQQSSKLSGSPLE